MSQNSVTAPTLGNDFCWPVITIDFEASALGRSSWPIEVGTCRWTSPEAPLEGWSSLIRPTAEWLDKGEWSPASAKIHHIPLADLDRGMNPATVMRILNRHLEGKTAWCDGGTGDQHWLDRLADAAGIAPAFELGDLDCLTENFSLAQLRKMFLFSARTTIIHRARADAEMHIQALAHALGYDQLALADWALL